jgi:hypothetical protein
VQHILFWFGLIALFTLLRTIRNEDSLSSWQTLIFEIIPFSGVASAVYFNQIILLPRFLSTKRYLVYTLSLLGITLINAIIIYVFFELAHPIFIKIGHKPHPKSVMFFPAYMTMQMIFVSLTSFFYFVKENSRLNEIAVTVTEIESNRLKAELKSLKAQINPHFLFNTLNNIYSYSLFKSERTPEMILKLSDLMNYIIYECQADQVDLQKEIDFIYNYVELEKLRVEDSLDIKLEIPDNPVQYRIAPLIFVTFLENAFKHGAHVQEKNPFINLKLEVDASGLLHFNCENIFDQLVQDDLPGKKGGIGLDNIKKRLELLYPGHYQLNISNKTGRYSVDLTIQLEDD